MKKLILAVAVAVSMLSCTQDAIPGKDGADGKDGIDGKNGIDGTNASSQGKEFIIITGTVTNELVAKQLAKELGPNTEHVSVFNTTGLTSLDLSSLSSGWEIFIGSNADLVSVNLNGLKKVNNVSFTYNPKLSAVSMENVSSANNIQLLSSSINTMSLPRLEYATLFLSDCSSLSAINLPLFLRGSLSVNNTSVTSINLPALKAINGNFMIYNNKKLSSVSFPSLVEMNIPNYIYFIDNALTSSEVNKLLNIFNTKLAFTGYSKTIYLQGQSVKAPPTGQGIIDKNMLISKGFSVTTD